MTFPRTPLSAPPASGPAARRLQVVAGTAGDRRRFSLSSILPTAAMLKYLCARTMSSRRVCWSAVGWNGAMLPNVIPSSARSPFCALLVIGSLVIVPHNWSSTTLAYTQIQPCICRRLADSRAPLLPFRARPPAQGRASKAPGRGSRLEVALPDPFFESNCDVESHRSFRSVTSLAGASCPSGSRSILRPLHR